MATLARKIGTENSLFHALLAIEGFNIFTTPTHTHNACVSITSSTLFLSIRLDTFPTACPLLLFLVAAFVVTSKQLLKKIAKWFPHTLRERVRSGFHY